MTTTAEKTKAQEIEEKKKSWDAFLDAYQALLTERNALDDLCYDMLNSLSKTNAKYSELSARYSELKLRRN